MVYKFFDKKASGSGIKNESISDKELAEELYKPIIRKITERNVYSFFTDNIWSTDLDLVNMQLRSKLNEWICFLLCIIETFSKYA